MNTILQYEQQLEYIQRRMNVSREYILETCRLSRVSIDKIVTCIKNGKHQIKKLTLKV